MTSVASAESILQVSRDRLHGYVRSARLPMVLAALPGGQALEVSEPMLALIDRSREQALQSVVPDFTDDPAATRASLRMLSDGTLDGYTRRIRMPHPNGTSLGLQVRVDACDNRGPNRLAVVTVLPADGGPALTEPVPEANQPNSRVIGTLTADGVVDRVVSDDADLLSMPTSTVLERPLLDLVHPEDAGALTMLAAHASARTSGVTGRTRVRGPDGAWRAARIALQPLASNVDDPNQSVGFAFALVSEPAPTAVPPWSVEGVQAAATRNQQQLRAASEAARLTLVAAVMESPRVAGLSEREREVVTRILAGQRVAAIARELYLSQSTVRNHLTGAYRKVGVNSQAGLLELLHPVASAH